MEMRTGVKGGKSGWMNWDVNRDKRGVKRVGVWWKRRRRCRVLWEKEWRWSEKCKASEGERVWQRGSDVGCGEKESRAEKRSEWVGEREPDRVFSDGATLKHVKSPTTTVRRDVGTGQSKEKRAATPTCWARSANYSWNIRVSAYPPTASFSPLRCRLPHCTLQKMANMPTILSSVGNF